MKRILALCLACGTGLPLQAQTPVRRQFAPMPDAKLASIPNFVLPDIYRDRTAHPLPPTVDNTKSRFMPAYTGWSIQGWSCANATATSFIYGYEAQRVRNLSSSGNHPLYTYEYTYHFLNSGDQARGGDGWMFVEALDILKKTGGATSADFGGFEWGNSFGGWMSGYDKYYNAMKVRVDEYYKIDASVASGDELIKQILHDHGNQSPEGALLTFQVNSSNWTTATVSGRRTFTKLGSGGGHALNIAGYDNAFEGGSWLCVNNWGDGIYWAPYRLLRAGAGLATSQGTPVMFARVKRNYSPKVTFKVTLSHNQRNAIAILTGVAASATAAAPTRTQDYAGAFNFSGGAFPMVGKGMSETIEIGLDVTDFLPTLSGGGRFFLQIVSKGGAGRVNNLTLMDYTGGQVREIPAGETNKPIVSGATTTLSVPWTGPSAIRGGAGGFAKAFASPNPARRGGAPIRFTLAGAGGAASAGLRILDSRGRVVYSPAAQTVSQSLGSDMELFWEMKDSQGRQVAPGLYTAVLQTRDAAGKTRLNSARIRVLE